jgi:hypothetical protein
MTGGDVSDRRDHPGCSRQTHARRPGDFGTEGGESLDKDRSLNRPEGDCQKTNDYKEGT